MERLLLLKQPSNQSGGGKDTSDGRPRPKFVVSDRCTSLTLEIHITTSFNDCVIVLYLNLPSFSMYLLACKQID
jgi:hypothetical protein